MKLVIALLLVTLVNCLSVTSVRNLIEDARREVEVQLNQVPGLAEEQKRLLVQSVVLTVETLANEYDLQQLPPNQVDDYIRNLQTLINDIIAEAVQRARTLVNQQERAIENLWPRIKEVIAKLHARFDALLNRITGLTTEQRHQLIREFFEGLKNFPKISAANILTGISNYVERVTDFTENLIKALIAKARVMVNATTTSVEVTNEALFPGVQEVGSNGLRQQRQLLASIFGGRNDRPPFQSLGVIESLIKALYEGLVGNFLKTLAAINGLTSEQIAQLENEFRNGLDQFPRPPLSEFYNPLRWISWARKLTDHALSLSQKLLQQARLLADNFLSKLPQEQYQKREFEKNMVQKLK